MAFNILDFSELPAQREAAFTTFVHTINEELSRSIDNDRRLYCDHNGNYEGSYGPERSYVTTVLAFLDEYGIDSDITDISDLDNSEFSAQFGRFKSKVEYLTTRFNLRQRRIKIGDIGTLIIIQSDYKSEIGKLLETIKKIVNQEIMDKNKKDIILRKIAALQSEVDRDQTTIDALFGRVLDLSQNISPLAENIEPLLEKLERIKKIFWDSPKKVDHLPKPDRKKMLPKPENNSNEKDFNNDDLDGDILF